MQTDGPPVHFLNIEYFFRLIYGIVHGGGGAVSTGGGISFAGFFAFISHLWLIFTILAFLASLAALGLFVYSTMRYFQVRALEAPLYATRTREEENRRVDHSRWAYIMQLIESGQPSDWRNAIIEADIMLDEVLTQLGYAGDSVGEKLKAVNENHFHTLNNAWEAHKVRNEIAHSGSQFELSEHIAHRTIANYGAVFREHGEI